MTDEPDRTNPSGICDTCGTHRGPGIPDYHPIQVVAGLPYGWYWGPGEGVELCPACLTALMEKANQ
jgi:hypothetical protein